MSTAAEIRPGTPEWDERQAELDWWRNRPLGRDATPGHLCGPDRPGEWPNGGPKCRRCWVPCSLDGHPYGCPVTPKDDLYSYDPLRPCYCGQTMILWALYRFGPCCENTPPVKIPGGCRWCGSDLCRVNEPEDLPDRSYFALEVRERFPEFNTNRGAWVHTRCVEEWLLEKGRADLVARRRADREVPVGEAGPRKRGPFD